MKPIEVRKDIFWVGVVDFDHRDFHGYSRCPDGTTSNAFLVKDEKSALIDTVSPGHAGALLCRLAKTMPPEKVDYIVCNHMELDHQGVLEEIVDRVKPEKIFVSTMGMKSMTGYFADKGWPVQAVKTGDVLELGRRRLVFHETRMLHWPDSMVAYVPEEKLLFSNDIFGQNIASSARFVDEFHDEAEVLHRIKEYFYNIVLPYSPQVLKALPALAQLDIETIAPDHGLIYRTPKDVQRIISLYKELAEQKPQQQAVIFYDTMWDSTEKMAYAICNGLEENDVPTRIMSVKANHHSAIMTQLADCGAVLAGSPTHNNGLMPLVAAMCCYMSGLKPRNRVGGAFGSCGWSGESPKVLQDQLAAMQMDMPVAPLKCFWRPTKEVYKACNEMGKAIAEALKAKVAAAQQA